MSLALGCRAEDFWVPGCRSLPRSVVLNATCAGWGQREPGDSHLPSQSRPPAAVLASPLLLPPSLYLPTPPAFPSAGWALPGSRVPLFPPPRPPALPLEKALGSVQTLSAALPGSGCVGDALRRKKRLIPLAPALPFLLSPRAARRHCRTLGSTWNCIRGRHRYFKVSSGRPIHAVAVINLLVCTDWSVRVPKGF